MFQRVSEKYEDLLFRFICECELDPPQNPALLAAVEILELLSLLQLYLNRWTPGVAESPLVSVFVGVRYDFDSEIPGALGVQPPGQRDRAVPVLRAAVDGAAPAGAVISLH